jgi:hypothetical protein
MSAPVQQLISGITAPMGTAAVYLGNQLAPIQVPEPTAIFDAARKSYISVQLATEMLECHGIIFSDSDGPVGSVNANDAFALNNAWHRVYLSGHTTPGDADAVQWLLRHPDQVTYVDQMLVRNGWVDPTYKAMMIELGNVIPGSGQLISYAAGNLLSPQFVEDWGLNDGYPKGIDDWQRANGIQWDIGITGFGNITNSSITFARLDWWSHWNLPGISQLEDMRHRLRGRIDDPSQARDPSGLIFTDAQIDALYGPNNVPPGFVLATQAMNYKPASIRVLQGMAQSKQVPQSEITEILLDQGYNSYTAGLLSNYYWTKPDITRLQALQKEVFNDIVAAYELGLYESNAAAVLMESATLPNAGAITAFNALAPAQQQVQALANPEVVTALRHADMKIAHDNAEKLIKNIQYKFERQSYDSADSRKALMSIGLTLGAANRYIDQWTNKLTIHHKELQTSDLMKMYNEGIINTTALVARLTNLGWNATDVQLLLVERNQENAVIAAKQAAALAKTAAEKAAASARLIAAQKKAAAREAEKLIKRAGTQDLEKYYERGVISADQFNRGMAAIGWSPSDIVNAKRYIDSIIASHQKKRQQPKTTSTGSTGSKARRSSSAAIVSWWGKGIIDYATAVSKLSTLGYGSDEVHDMLQLEQDKPSFAGQPIQAGS